MGNVVIATSHISLDQRQWSRVLSCHIRNKAASKGDMDSMASLDTPKAFRWYGMGVSSLLHHPIAKEHFVSKIEVSFHEEGM